MNRLKPSTDSNRYHSACHWLIYISYFGGMVEQIMSCFLMSMHDLIRDMFNNLKLIWWNKDSVGCNSYHVHNLSHELNRKGQPKNERNKKLRKEYHTSVISTKIPLSTESFITSVQSVRLLIKHYLIEREDQTFDWFKRIFQMILLKCVLIIHLNRLDQPGYISIELRTTVQWNEWISEQLLLLWLLSFIIKNFQNIVLSITVVDLQNNLPKST